MLVFQKARERSEPATLTLVATSSLRLLLASLAARFARWLACSCLNQGSLASLAHLQGEQVLVQKLFALVVVKNEIFEIRILELGVLEVVDELLLDLGALLVVVQVVHDF